MKTRLLSRESSPIYLAQDPSDTSDALESISEYNLILNINIESLKFNIKRD